MTRISLVHLLSAVVIVFLVPSVEARGGDARIFHVGPTGDDKNSGAEASPLKTIQAAAVLVRPGDTVLIGEGICARTAAGKAGVEWVNSKYAKVSFARSETTVAQYRACVEAGKCESKHHLDKSDSKYCNWGYSDRDNHPMNCVAWYGAEQFCEWAGGRLPTEQEWEAEAGAGGSRMYPWGGENPSCTRCIMDDKSTKGSAGSETDGCGEDHTWPVCSKRRGDSVSGLCDMAGSVWEWTSSWYDSDKKKRVLRGGSWFYDYFLYFRASYRSGYSPDVRHDNFGFRCVVSSQ